MDERTKMSLKEILNLALQAPKSIDWSKVDPALLRSLGVELKKVLTSENSLKVMEILLQIAIAGRSRIVGPLMFELAKLALAKGASLSAEDRAKMQDAMRRMVVHSMTNRSRKHNE